MIFLNQTLVKRFAREFAHCFTVVSHQGFSDLSCLGLKHSFKRSQHFGYFSTIHGVYILSNKIEKYFSSEWFSVDEFGGQCFIESSFELIYFVSKFFPEVFELKFFDMC